MELFDVITKKSEEQHNIINFPDKSLIDGLVIDNKEHLGYDPDESRRIWVDGGFLHGYLHLFKLQYETMVQIAKSLERENKRQKKSTADLLKEIKRLNQILSDMNRRHEQLTIDFAVLKQNVDLNIKKQHAVLEQLR